MVEEDSNQMIVIDGVDGSGKGVQTRRLLQSFADSGQSAILTREPGGSAAAEEIRKLLVEGEPDRWDSMTELLLMYASRRAHLRDTIMPALSIGKWVISDRFADSSRAYQGAAGELGLETVEKMHQIVIEDFQPSLVLILDIPETVALSRAKQRGDSEDRFEKKGPRYLAKVRQAFLAIADSHPSHYRVINAEQTVDQVSAEILDAINRHFRLNLKLSSSL